MKKKLIIFCGYLFLSANVSNAFECPTSFKDRQKMPKCVPGKKAQVLADTYPVGALVISKPDLGFGHRSDAKTIDTMQTTYNLIYKIAQNDTETPLIVAALNQEDFDRLVNQINESNLSPLQKKKILLRLAHAPVSDAWNWQQDLFQSTVDSSGKVFLRPNQTYLNQRDTNESFQSVLKILKKCGVSQGESLQAEGLQATALVDGMSGGNIEALPDGTCLIGDDHFKNNDHAQFVKSVCGDRGNIEVPTHWLQVGHTDEILKILPIKNEPINECSFTVALASPKLAMDLMEKNPNDYFFETSNPLSEDLGKSQDDIQKLRVESYGPTKAMCKEFEKLKIKRDSKSKDPAIENDSESGVSKIILPDFMNKFADLIKKTLFSPARADLVVDDEQTSESSMNDVDEYSGSSIFDVDEQRKNDLAQPPNQSIADIEKKSSEQPQPEVECFQSTNSEMLKVFENANSGVAKTNAYVQRKMDDLELVLQDQLKSKYPKCQIEIQKYPQLFQSNFDETGTRPKYAAGINPNPTNGIVMGKNYYIPDQNNKAFQSYMEKLTKKNGLKPDFINTFEFAHAANGNLHCSTQSISLCR